jgi:tRNA ligase
VALAHIFGFGHTQSDDVQAKNKKARAPVFVKSVVDLLHKHDAVIADKYILFSLYISKICSNYYYDRCNHLTQHRLSLRDAARNFPQPVRLVALNWSLDKPPATIHRICGDRIQQRGDNHQTLRADLSSKSHEAVVWMFINTTQELTPKEVDNVVEMELGESLEESVKRAVEGCVAVMGLEMPSEEKIQEGLNVARGYAPALKRPDDPIDKKKLEAQYYCLLPEVELEELLDRALENENQPIKDFWKDLKTDKRVTKRPHITIIHRNSVDTERNLWNRCTALHEMTTAVPLFKGTLRNVLWDGRVMAITVEDFDVAETAEGSSSGSNDNEKGREFVSNLPDDIRSRLHITVGTRYESIKAVEAKSMVEQWRRGEEKDMIKFIKLDVDHIVYGRIKGLSK